MMNMTPMEVEAATTASRFQSLDLSNVYKETRRAQQGWNHTGPQSRRLSLSDYSRCDFSHAEAPLDVGQ